jgi:hypothetical protein
LDLFLNFNPIFLFVLIVLDILPILGNGSLAVDKG